MFCIFKGNAHHPLAEELSLLKRADAAAHPQSVVFADPCHAGVGGKVSLPPSAEGEGVGSYLFLCNVFAPFNSYRSADLRRDAQPF